MKLKSLAGTVCSTLIFALLTSPAFANIVNCVSGNLSTVDGTTCDIGNLQFTFTGLQGSNSDGIPWTDSEFTLTVLSNGFELSGPQAQTITASSNGVVLDQAELDFNVTDLTDAIVGLVWCVINSNDYVFTFRLSQWRTNGCALHGKSS